MLGVKDIAFINSALVFSLMRSLSDRDRSRFSGNRDQYIKESDQIVLHP